MLDNNIQIIRSKISKKCADIGRKIDDITLVAVSKRKPINLINEALALGIFDFGENKAQELNQKFNECSNKIKWHFIGHLQTNKVKDVVSAAYLIHSIDSIKVAKEVNKRAVNINKVQNILLEVNTSGEESKFGLKNYEEVLELANYCKDANNISLVGLMTMAPYSKDENLIRNSFKALNDIFVKLNSNGYKLCELSMGMTNDFEIAIEEGATIIRIGTAIFGNRF